MNNFIVPGPDGGIPSITYLEHLKDAGVLPEVIINNQINAIHDYNKTIQGNLKKKKEIINNIIKQKKNSNQNNQHQIN
jgi:hypothetical protein